MNYAEMSEKLIKILELKTLPVAVKLIRKGDPLPEGYEIPEKNMSHCKTIMAARNGKSYLMPADKHGCLIGASSLGLVPTPPKAITGEFHHNIKLFDSDEAAAKMIAARPELEEGSTIATLVTPLKDAKMKPDVVVIVDRPESIYWLVPARTYYEGGRISASLAAFQATCADATLIPMMTGDINLTLGCFGCRRRTDIHRDEMIAGIPIERMESIMDALEKIHMSGKIDHARANTVEESPFYEK